MWETTTVCILRFPVHKCIDLVQFILLCQLLGVVIQGSTIVFDSGYQRASYASANTPSLDRRCFNMMSRATSRGNVRTSRWLTRFYSRLEKWFDWLEVILVEDIHKMGEKLVKDHENRGNCNAGRGATYTKREVSNNDNRAQC